MIYRGCAVSIKCGQLSFGNQIVYIAYFPNEIMVIPKLVYFI